MELPEFIVPAGAPRMAGKVVVVSGGGSAGAGIGNGRAAAILAALQGARVVVADADLAAAEATVGMIAGLPGDPGEATALACDVTDPAQCEAVAAAARSRFGRLDGLVNNVGTSGPRGTAIDVDPDEWDAGMALNVKSMMLMAKYCAPPMRDQGAGAIVNIASLSGLLGGFPDLLYPTSKGAVVNMTRAMAGNFGRFGIRANCVAPGKVFTPHMVNEGVDEEMREHRRRQSALGTEGTAWDVGAAVLFLLSDEARWITGAVLPVDAGASAVQNAGAAWPRQQAP